MFFQGEGENSGLSVSDGLTDYYMPGMEPVR